MITFRKSHKGDEERLMAFMHMIYDGMPDKSWFAMDEDEELLRIFERGMGISCIAEDDAGEIAAIALINIYDPADPGNMGYACGYTEEELKETAVMDIVMVRGDMRGQGLQVKSIMKAEEYLKEAGYKHVTASVDPENIYSLNNALKAGYEIKNRKILYYGLDRYVLCKEL